MALKIVWTDETLHNLKSILDYLESEWTKREIKQFFKLLEKRIHLISHQPEAFGLISKNRNIRRSVLTTQTT